MNRKAVIIGISVIAAVAVFLLVIHQLGKEPVETNKRLPVVTEKPLAIKGPRIIISEEDQSLMGIRKTEIEKMRFRKSVRIQGRIDYDTEKTSEVETNINGVVESVSAEEGAYVKKGDLLIEINSPEILTAQQDLIAATRPGSTSSASAAEAARKRLRQMGISDELISQIEKTGAYARNIKITSPVTGYIVKAYASKGDSIADGDKLILIADLSSVLFVGEANEQDAPFVKKGENAEVLMDLYPDRIFDTKIESNTPSGVLGKPSKVGMRIANADNGLKPGMQGSADIKVDLGEKLAVPMEAIIDKDGRKIVYVEASGEKFEARTVKTGIVFESQAEILGGLKEGELVVSSGVTKVDSEAERQRLTEVH